MLASFALHPQQISLPLTIPCNFPDTNVAGTAPAPIDSGTLMPKWLQISQQRRGMQPRPSSQGTQMILKRLQTGQAGQVPAPTSPRSIGPHSGLAVAQLSKDANKSLEDVRERLLQSIKPSSMMVLPAQPLGPQQSQPAFVPYRVPPRRALNTTPTPRQQIAPKAASPAGNTLHLPAPTYAMPQPLGAPASRPQVLGPQNGGSKVFKPVIKPVSRTGRRLSGKDTAFGFSDSSDEEGAQAHTQTTTKSGRQVQRPAQFIPNQDSNRKKIMSKRTEAQAMCQLCKRLAFVDDNQIVFCDSCNDAWHQQCAHPTIPPQVASSDIPWFCAKCQGRKQAYIGSNDGLVAWNDRTLQEKSAYLSTIPHSMLLSLFAKALKQQPDLPLFPAMENEDPAEQPARGANGSPSRSKPAAATNGSSSSFLKRHGKNAMNREVEVDLNLMPELEPHLKWPKHGGLYAELPPEKKDKFLEDEDDYEAFSVIKYDRNGNKIWENGVDVEVQKGRGRP
ncbi:hypothetical protein MKZ38_003065 [Zalerion maritima]|uniref:PHD-type domain-containing protein n=1 Tax=Zalerion maritima TaxID=339359 RepID=A0AAD5RN68_9PEZI|nr:hypothetical protein MKZ38_003065 [Zalerion maritima]